MALLNLGNLAKKVQLTNQARKLSVDYEQGKQAVNKISRASSYIEESASYIQQLNNSVFASDWIGDSASEISLKVMDVKKQTNLTSSQIASISSSLSNTVEEIKTTERRILALINSLK